MEYPVRRALLSVSDKTGLVEFSRELVALGVELVSTGGTARVLKDAAIPLLEVEAFTGFPEMLDGRVKTLHPAVHAGILHRRDQPSHVDTLAAHDLVAIDLVVVNLYPFEETVARPDATRVEAVENIDIGGPAMIRSAAKNHDFVTVVVSPEQYERVAAELRAHGGSTTPQLRRRLAREAFRRTSSYDVAIARYLEQVDGKTPEAPTALPATLSLSLTRSRVLRYGENPHQAAALFGDALGGLQQLAGKELSYNNILDFTAAWEMAQFVGRAAITVAIVKHSNPCGMAQGSSVAEAWERALATDPLSASGGIVASSGAVDATAAKAMREHFIEILAAPSFDPEALEILGNKKSRILLQVPPGSAASPLTFRSVPGGVLAQTPDTRRAEAADFEVVTQRSPTEAELAALRFGWDVVRFVKSNAIVFASKDRTLGIGAGQMSRVDAVRIGVLKAKDAGLRLEGSAIASDAFFPFPDGLLQAADAGATAAIQPGGSVRDAQVIAAADERGMAMVFTGMRHFRH